jgi:hypothetical protein
MKHIAVIIVLFIMLVALIAAGCIGSPTPTPTPTATPAPTVTPTPVPTLIGKNDEAHVQFFYSMGTASDYGGLKKASPGNLLYIIKVKVSSDKPVQTSLAWFWVEYKVNATDIVHDSNAIMAYVQYPEKTIGSDQGPAKGELLIELPAKLAEGYPKPYYYMPLEQQQGPYKVYDKVYGVVGDVQ